MNASPDDPPPSKKQWDAEEDRILKIMQKQGQKWHTVAARLGRSPEEVEARFLVLYSEQEQKLKGTKLTPSLEQVNISEQMVALLEDQPALEALFTLLCGKYNEQGILLKQLSQMLSLPKEEITERLAECLFVSISVRLGSDMTEELRMVISRQMAVDILSHFHVLPIFKLQLKNGQSR